MCHTFITCVLFGCLRMVVMVFKCFKVFCKCFRSMFQVFQLPLDVCCNCCIWISKSRSGVASLLPTFCYIASLGVDRASIRRRCRALSNWRRHMCFPSCRLGGMGPMWSAKQSVERERLFIRLGASTSIKKIHS
jgi:hypothetical protein